MRTDRTYCSEAGKRPDLSDLDRKTAELTRRVAALELAIKKLLEDR